MKPATTRHAQRGAALLQAMLTVTLVATFAAAALWQQWRSVEVEAAERARVQSAWILVGALDWARLILRIDAQSDAQQNGQADHLAEPWAVPLAESRLSSFLAADKNNSGGQTSEEQLDAFLSGQISDLQGRLNLRNLVENSALSQVWYDAFAKLFQLLGLPESQLSALADNLRRAWAAPDADSGAAPIGPQRIAQLVNYGLSPPVLAALEPYIALLPIRPTPVNVNTASAVVLAASEPALNLADAERLVAARASHYFRSAAEAGNLLSASPAGGAPQLFTSDRYSVGSNYFEVRGRLRLESITLEERSVLQRQRRGFEPVFTTLSRERLSFDERVVFGADGTGSATGPRSSTAPPP